MSLQLGNIAPDFTAESTQGIVRFHAWLGKSWGLLFSHPADFTPVFASELGRLSHLGREFKRRNVKVMGISASTLEAQQLWLQHIKVVQETAVDFPLVADPNYAFSRRYGLLQTAADQESMKSIFVIGPNKEIRLRITCPILSTRNFHEILLLIDSLQYASNEQYTKPKQTVRACEEVVLSVGM